VGFGANAVDELNRIMQVRGAALKRFGRTIFARAATGDTRGRACAAVHAASLPGGSASKLVGGMDYTFALRGDGQTPTQILAPAEQRRALAAVLATLKPDVLRCPSRC